MNNTAKLALAAAAVLVAAFLGWRFFLPANVGGPGLADPTPSPTPAARLWSPTGPIEAGVYDVTDDRYTPVAVKITVPTGWDAGDAGGLSKNADEPTEVGVAFNVVTHVYEDACASEGTLTEIGPSAADLVAALVAQQNTDVVGPTDLTIGGNPAQRVDVAIPASLDTATCRHPGILTQIWADPAETNYFALAIGSSGSVYVADIEGQRVVITAGYGPDASEEDRAEIDEMLASVRFAPEP